MSPSFGASGTGEPVTSTTSPGWEKLKNQCAFSGERLAQPCETFATPCCATDHGAECANSPLFEIRTAHCTTAVYPPASSASPNVRESMCCSGVFEITT